jgi:Zn/Cd-binding protein ZinT
MTNKKLLAGILSILLVFSFVLAGCDNGSDVDDPEPKLAEWAGTWNAIDQYLDNSTFDQVWSDAVASIKAANSSAVVDVDIIKGLTKQLVKTDFKSCVIAGNTMKIYDAPGATGSLTATITYTYAGVEGEGEDQKWKFTGDTAGQFKYLVLGPVERDDPNAMLHFHLQYSDKSFEAATGDNPGWEAMVTPTTTTVAQMAEDFAGFPWAAYADYFVPNLSEWAGTWNPVHWYFDETEIAAILQAQYDALPEENKQATTFEAFIAFVKTIARTDFGSFAIQGNKITFYDQKQTQKNPSGTVSETVTYTFKGIRNDVWGKGGPEEEEFDWYAFEGDTEGDHKYLLLEEAGRDTSTGPLHFHMRYGSKGFDDLLLTPTDNYGRWDPTIVSYDTTIAELQEFMSGD